MISTNSYHQLGLAINIGYEQFFLAVFALRLLLEGIMKSFLNLARESSLSRTCASSRGILSAMFGAVAMYKLYNIFAERQIKHKG